MSKSMKFETAYRALHDPKNAAVRAAGIHLFAKGEVDPGVPLSELIGSYDYVDRLAALAYGWHLTDLQRRLLFLSLEDSPLAWKFTGAMVVPPEYIEETLEAPWADEEVEYVTESCKYKYYPQSVVLRWLKSDNAWLRRAGLYASFGRDDISYSHLVEALNDWYAENRDLAAQAIRSRHPAVRTFVRGDGTPLVSWRYIPTIFDRRPDALEVLERCLLQKDDDIALAAAKAMVCAAVPLKKIDAWRQSEHRARRAAAMYASIGRPEVPLEWIAAELQLGSSAIQDAAFLAQLGRKDVKYWWDFCPSDPVYISCVGGVTAEAIVPEGASVHADPDTGIPLATELKIVKIHGDFCGAKVGITDAYCTHIYRAGRKYRYDGPPEEFYDHGLEFCEDFPAPQLV